LLTQSKITSGLQCRKRLWALVHRPPAHNDGTRDLRRNIRMRVLEQALKHVSEQATLNVAVEHQGVRVIVDALVPFEQGLKLISVRSAGGVKAHHLNALAIQWVVAEGAGHPLNRAEIIHINVDHNGPLTEPLYLTVDVTTDVQRMAAEIGDELPQLVGCIDGDEPDPEPGRHCFHPYTCPFAGECHPEAPHHTLNELYRVKARVLNKIKSRGIEYIKDIPDDIPLPPIPARQRQACRLDSIVLGPGLTSALDAISFPAAFIDFEAIQPAIPPWTGCRPFAMIPVQVSIHKVEADGTMTHHEWLAEDNLDPQPPLARWVANAIEGAATLIAYHASFEKSILAKLASVAPQEDAKALRDAMDRFVDLLPMMRNHVYHPEFRGRFNLKTIVAVLLPDLAYSTLEVQRGDVASMLLEEFIVHGQPMDASLRAKRRDSLLRYCERDTLSLVELVRLLRISTA
jgi:hypothetical protein